MNGNDPRAQDYGQACDAAANRALTHFDKLTPMEQLVMALDLAEIGGVNRAALLEQIIGEVTAMDEFGEGAFKGGW